MILFETVDDYIEHVPKDIRGKLSQLRSIIKKVAPKAVERISYGMPYYHYKGRLVYFGLAKNHIGLYLPPPIIEEHKNNLQRYVTTVSAVHLSLDKKLPVGLITQLVKARLNKNEAGKF